MITIQTDGNGDGYYIALFPNSKRHYDHQKGITHNEAEYNGVILALQKLSNKSKAIIQTDSQLVVGQLTEGWKINLPHLYDKVEYINQIIENKSLDITFEWIKRERNVSDIVLRRHLKKVGILVKENPYDTIKKLKKEIKKLRLIIKNAHN